MKLVVEESLHVAFDESNISILLKHVMLRSWFWYFESNLAPNSEAPSKRTETKSEESLQNLSKDWKILHNQPRLKDQL